MSRCQFHGQVKLAQQASGAAVSEKPNGSLKTLSWTTLHCISTGVWTCLLRHCLSRHLGSAKAAGTGHQSMHVHSGQLADQSQDFCSCSAFWGTRSIETGLASRSRPWIGMPHMTSVDRHAAASSPLLAYTDYTVHDAKGPVHSCTPYDFREKDCIIHTYIHNMRGTPCMLSAGALAIRGGTVSRPVCEAKPADRDPRAPRALMMGPPRAASTPGCGADILSLGEGKGPVPPLAVSAPFTDLPACFYKIRAGIDYIVVVVRAIGVRKRHLQGLLLLTPRHAAWSLRCTSCLDIFLMMAPWLQVSHNVAESHYYKPARMKQTSDVPGHDRIIDVH